MEPISFLTLNDGPTAIDDDAVTAGGEFARASATEQPDLFWGLRGQLWHCHVLRVPAP